VGGDPGVAQLRKANQAQRLYLWEGKRGAEGETSGNQIEKKTQKNGEKRGGLEALTQALWKKSTPRGTKEQK